ncbi:hypothetical protein Goarm_009441, partial [Gossypium armourianum]|nr:hypothetical protein [Gossypium armourianum]
GSYPYLAVVLNFSQTWALYCLLQFYAVTKEKLEPIRPLAKFLTFKSIVFLTWWQGVAVAFLFSMGAFKGSLAQELKTRIQDYIICIEALLHEVPVLETETSFKTMSDIPDFEQRRLEMPEMVPLAFRFVFEMGVAAVVHLYVFPAVPYKRGERCVRNVAVMTDYASLGTPPDPEEVQDCERTTRMRLDRHYEREKRLNFPQSVRDVVLGSGEIVRHLSICLSGRILFLFSSFLSFCCLEMKIVDDMKYTVSHVVEPVERG